MPESAFRGHHACGWDYWLNRPYPNRAGHCWVEHHRVLSSALNVGVVFLVAGACLAVAWGISRLLDRP